MGIKNLAKLIADCAPGAVKETEFKALFGRKIAIDASMAIYQFLIAIRQQSTSSVMVNDQGKDTSHLVGLFYRYAFDCTSFCFDHILNHLKFLSLSLSPTYIEPVRC